jgi:phosphatidate phosphatase APP1
MANKQSLHLQIYTSFYTKSHVYLKGRLLRDKPLEDQENSGILKALFYTLLRALSREVTGKKVACWVGSRQVDMITDDEGYFELYENTETLAKDDFTTIRLTVDYKGAKNSKTVQLTDYSRQVPVGIISDIDDTIMVTGVKSFFKLKVAINTLFLNPFRRKPIEDAAAAFHQLSEQVEGRGPVIYISNSPWNLYDYLKNFLKHNGFPNGIVMLRDMGWQLLKSRTIKERNKYLEIKKILATFQESDFILIGDSGELDFDIYQQVLKEHPDRIRRVIINKAGNKEKEAEILQHAEEHPRFELIQGYSSIVETS